MTNFVAWWIAFGEILPLLLVRWIPAWIASFILLVFFIGIARRQYPENIKKFDEKIRDIAQRWRYRKGDSTERIALTWFFRFWTNFGSSPSLTFFAFAVPIAFFMNAPQSSSLFRGTEIWLMPGVCFGGGMLLSFCMKRVFKRARPVRKRGAFGHKMRDHSFPSGHSLTAICFWPMIVACLATHSVALWIIVLLSAAALSFILLTGISRVYLGVHWPSDIIGGYGIGAIWTIICYIALFHFVLEIPV